MENEMGQATERGISVDTLDHIITLFGNFDENARIIEAETGAFISARDTMIMLRGDDDKVELAKTVIGRMLEMIRKNEKIDRSRIRYAIELAREGHDDLIGDIMSDVIAVTYRGKQVRCKTVGQRKYINAIKKNTVVFGVGPAGTGKTYLAMAMAVLAFKSKEVSRIILTRPAVEAGEKLGFLPGDLQNKVDPYLRPLYDALYEFVGVEAYQKMTERGSIEVAPLAYMRGRTLSDAFIILDEAQNCTKEQMKMFLTRFGENSKVIVTGDITQIDLPGDKKSGLVHALSVMKGIDDIEIIRLTHQDVVRHELVQNIIKAYDNHEKRAAKKTI